MSKEALNGGIITRLRSKVALEERLINKRNRWLSEIGTGEVQPDNWENALKVGDTKEHVEESIKVHSLKMEKADQELFHYQRGKEFIDQAAIKQSHLSKIKEHVAHGRLSSEVGEKFQAELDGLEEQMLHDPMLRAAVAILLKEKSQSVRQTNIQSSVQEPAIEPTPKEETPAQRILKLITAHSAENPLTLEEIKMHYPEINTEDLKNLIGGVNKEAKKKKGRVCSVPHNQLQEETYYYEQERDTFHCKLKDHCLKSNSQVLPLTQEQHDLLECIAWGGTSGHRSYRDIQTRLFNGTEEGDAVAEKVEELKNTISEFFGTPDILVTGGNEQVGRWAKLKDVDIHLFHDIEPRKLEAFVMLLSENTPVEEIIASLGPTNGKTGRPFNRGNAAKALSGVRHRLDKNGTYSELASGDEWAAWQLLLEFKAEHKLSGYQMDEYIFRRFGLELPVSLQTKQILEK